MSVRPEPVEWGVATRCRRGEDAERGPRDGEACATAHSSRRSTAWATGARLPAPPGRPAGRARQRGGELVLLGALPRGMSDTRGAAISLAFVSAREGRMSWLGVGNVEGRVLSGDPSARRLKGSLALLNGVPGHQLPYMRTATIDLGPATSWSWPRMGLRPDSPTRSTPRGRRRRSATGSWPTREADDDALVVTVRYLGGDRERGGAHRGGSFPARLCVGPAAPTCSIRRGLAPRRLRARARGREPAAQRARPGRRSPRGPAVDAGRTYRTRPRLSG